MIASASGLCGVKFPAPRIVFPILDTRICRLKAHLLLQLNILGKSQFIYLPVKAVRTS